MKLENGLFAVKLYEMEKQYVLLQSRLQLCQAYDHEKLKRSIDVLKDECETNDLMLEKHVRQSQSTFASELARAQLTYKRQVESIVQSVLSSDTSADNRAETLALHAEFAIDFATQAMNEALLAAMYALDAQCTSNENDREEEK
ncbi:MAG: hypothetical protein E7322_03085 [Clostridiales bacterium]|nr:hypothetical protein [Clostridiales bacterium]